MSKNNNILMILIILSLLFTIIGGTLAWFRWKSGEGDKTLVTFTIESGFSCSANGGGDITSQTIKLAPANCTDSDYVLKRPITVNTRTKENIVLDLWLNVNDTAQELLNSDNFKYAFVPKETVNASTDCTSVTPQTFKDNITDNKVYLITDESHSSNSTNFYDLYIWLDAAETSTSTMNKSFHFTIGGNCEQRISGTCQPGEYVAVNGESCVECPANSYCEGYSGKFDGAEHGRKSCSSLADGSYSRSNAGSSTSSSCYIPAANMLGKYVASANTASTTCTAGYYCPGTSNVSYGSTGGRTACTTGSYSASGATECTACTGTTTSGIGQTSCNATCNNNSNVSTWNTATWATNNTVSNLCSISSCVSNYALENGICVATSSWHYLSNNYGDTDGCKSFCPNKCSDAYSTSVWSCVTSGSTAPAGSSLGDGKYCWCYY